MGLSKPYERAGGSLREGKMHGTQIRICGGKAHPQKEKPKEPMTADRASLVMCLSWQKLGSA